MILLLGWLLMASVLLLPAPWCWVGLVGLIPVIHGGHDVLHGMGRADASRWASIHQSMLRLAASASQGMNLELLYGAHIHHHRYGRHDEGYAPDAGSPGWWSAATARYYISLVGLPALQWQVAGFARVLAPSRTCRLLQRFDAARSISGQFVLNQAAIVVWWGTALAIAGWQRLLVMELALCFVWSVQQNVAHYGIKGIDETTDRLCSRSYYLPWPLNWLTFGSTAHFLHHADMRVPPSQLYDDELLSRAEGELEVLVKREYGLWPYLRDLLRQFKGPVRDCELVTDWLVGCDRVQQEAASAQFRHRQGRSWATGNLGS